MNRPFGPTRFNRVSCHIGEPLRSLGRAQSQVPGTSGGLEGTTRLPVEREEHLLVALISALSDYEGRCGEWPPNRVGRLIDLAGSERVTGAPPRALQRDASRGCMRPWTRPALESILVEGLAALDAGLRAQTDATFEELCPIHRGLVLGAFVRGDLGHPREAAESFMGLLIEAVTSASLNFKFEVLPLSGATFDSVCAA